MDMLCELERLDHVLSTVRDSLAGLPEALGKVAGIDYADHLRPIVTAHFMVDKAVGDLRDISSRISSLTDQLDKGLAGISR